MKLVACFGVRYDKELLPDLIRNLDFVDEFAILYDFCRKELWINEAEYRLKLRKLAEAKEADWILITSPDERFEKNAGKKIRQLIEQDRDEMYQFNLKEMYTPTHFRTDGIWGKKKRYRLYPVREGQMYSKNKIQCPPYPLGSNLQIVDTGLNIYHLKMIEKRNRKLRQDVFKTLDPDRKFQSIGYDYLTDESSIQLEPIPKGREYYPEYKGYKFEVDRDLLEVE